MIMIVYFSKKPSSLFVQYGHITACNHIYYMTNWNLGELGT